MCVEEGVCRASRREHRRLPILSLGTGREHMIREAFSKNQKSLLESRLQGVDYSQSPHEFSVP